MRLTRRVVLPVPESPKIRIGLASLSSIEFKVADFVPSDETRGMSM